MVWQAFNAPQETSDALGALRLASKGNLTGHKADANAIKLIKEQQEQEKLDRQENGQGLKNSATRVFNSTSYPAVGIANLVKNGIGQKR